MAIEEVVIKYLEEKLNVKTYGEIPEKKPKEYIVVEKIDGGVLNKINTSSLSVYSTSDTLYNAEQLNEKVKIALLNIIELDNITSSRIGTERRNNDKENKRYRYETIINLYYYDGGI